MKRSARRRPKPASREEKIRAALDVAITHRQLTWLMELQAADPDWARLLGLHLQLCELENLTGALQEFL